MKTKYLLILLAVFGINACQSSSSNETAGRKNANQTQVVTNISKADKQLADAQKQAAASNIVQPKYFPGTGVITQINKNTSEVELNHEEVRGKMPAAKTRFKVRQNDYYDFLKDLKVGDKVSFVVEDDSGRIHISTISKKQTTQ